MGKGFHQCKKVGNDQELVQSIPHPTLKTKEEKTHTHKLINVHKIHARQAEWTALSQTGGHLATLPKNCSNIYLFLFIFYIKWQNKTKEEADWAAVFQVTLLLEVYTQA